jgi:chemotaxis protein MotB
VLAEALRKNKTNHIVVQGHTDNVPPGSSLRRRFPSNWELSAARAAAVVRFLQHEGKLNPKQLSLKAYGPYAPVASNNTEKGRMKNRRIEIVLDQP